MALLQQLAAVETWGVVLVAAGCGAGGALVHRSTEEAPEQPWWKTAFVGVIAAVGAISVTTPGSALELIGLSALSGFFARTVLATLESRLALELAKRQAERALAIAGDAIELSRRARPGSATGASDLDLGRLSARLDEVRELRPVEPKMR